MCGLQKPKMQTFYFGHWAGVGGTLFFKKRCFSCLEHSQTLHWGVKNLRYLKTWTIITTTACMLQTTGGKTDNMFLCMELIA